MILGGKGYEPCEVAEATHLKIKFPGPSGELILPVMIKGTREGTQNWTWNGDVEKPTLKPSVLTHGCDYKCHSWVNDGMAVFLDDSTHEFRGKVVEMLEV